jgi:DNA modification methylase
MYYWYFKLFNNIKSEHEANELARLELESLFGNVEPVYNFADKFREEPLGRFINSSIRLQDFITHELPYGRIQGYFGVSYEKKDVNKLVRRLAYTREIYLIVNSNEPPESFAKEIFSEGEFKKNFHYFKLDDFICFRFITHQYFLEKSEYISKLSRNEREVEKNVDILFSHLIDDIYRIPASSTLNVGKRLQDYFSIREEPSLYLTHYFHPYKGKFHPKMARALLNYVWPYDKGLILDNFAGSGTLLVEATTMGIDSLGVEINPLSALMSNVKCKSFSFNLEELKREINNYFEKLGNTLLVYNNLKEKQLSFFMETEIDLNSIFQKSKNLSSKLKNYLRNKNEIIPQILICKELLKNIQNDNIRDFLLLSLSGTISDVARRTSEQFFDVFRDRVNNLCLRIFLFKKLNEVLKIRLGHSFTYIGDARDMSQIIPCNYIDGIVTSPPYSVAIDYIKNDFPQLVLLELTDSIEKLEKDMIGNPRVNYSQKSLFIEDEENPLIISQTANKIVKYLLTNGRQQAGIRSFKFYIDMNKSLKEMYRVMKKNSKCAIVIGNNHFIVDNKFIEIPNDEVILELAEKIGFKPDKFIRRELQKSSEGNIREETILILVK